MKNKRFLEQELKKEEGHLVDPAYLELYLAIREVEDIAHMFKVTKRMSLPEFSVALRTLMEKLDSAEKRSAQLRQSTSTKMFLPPELAKYIRALRNAAVDLDSVTVSASDKSMRYKPAEVSKFVLTHITTDQLETILAKQAKIVESAVLKTRMGSDKAADRMMKAATAKYQRYYSKLPNKFPAGQMFDIIKMPVVPLFESMALNINPAPLRRAGIKVTQIGDGFMVLEDQHLLAFDRTKVGWESSLKKRGGVTYGPRRLSGPKQEESNFNQMMTIHQIVDELNARSGQQFVLASSSFIANPRNRNMMYAWLMPKQQESRLRFTAASMKVRWDFPFSRDFNVDED